TAFHDLVRNGKGGNVLSPFPTPPDVSTPPTPAILPNVEKRFRALSKRLKAHANYTVNIGKELMIVKGKQPPDAATAKPKLSLRIMGAMVEVIWFKGPWTSIEIQVSRNGGAWEPLTIDFTPNYMDT